MAKRRLSQKEKETIAKEILGDALTGMIFGESNLKLKGKKRTPSPSLPMEGHFKYFVKCERGGVYTSIGADNVHHASNKATKLFGPMWSQVTTEAELVRGYHFISHRDFSMLLAALPN